MLFWGVVMFSLCGGCFASIREIAGEDRLWNDPWSVERGH